MDDTKSDGGRTREVRVRTVDTCEHGYESKQVSINSYSEQRYALGDWGEAGMLVVVEEEGARGSPSRRHAKASWDARGDRA